MLISTPKHVPIAKENGLIQLAGRSLLTEKRYPNWSTIHWKKCFNWNEQLATTLDADHLLIAETFIQDLHTKLRRIIKTGLGYLTLDRQMITLSGGEAQRLRLASLLDSSLTGVLYVMDEPTMGLHPKDTLGLVSVMKGLRDLGNTVL